VFHRRAVYVGTIVVLVVLLVLALMAYTSTRDDLAAMRKADQLSGRLRAAGLPVPETSVLAQTFGTDGGAACDDPAKALVNARTNGGLTSGATGPGNRPIIAATDLVTGERQVLATYCPDKLPSFNQRVKDLKLEDSP
jgi:hypothetical protein